MSVTVIGISYTFKLKEENSKVYLYNQQKKYGIYTVFNLFSVA